MRALEKRKEKYYKYLKCLKQQSTIFIVMPGSEVEIQKILFFMNTVFCENVKAYRHVPFFLPLGF